MNATDSNRLPADMNETGNLQTAMTGKVIKRASKRMFSRVFYSFISGIIYQVINKVIRR